MKFIEFKKIRSRLVFWFLITSFVPLLISMVVFYVGRRKVNAFNTFEKLVSIRDLKANQVNKWLDERIGDMNVMSGDREIKELGNLFRNEELRSNKEEKIFVADELLRRNLTNYKDYSALFVIGSGSGQVEISTNKELKGKDLSREEYFTQPLKSRKLYISQVKRFHASQEPDMYFSIPIYDPENHSKIIGVLVAEINLEVSLYNLLLNRVGLGNTGETLIVNKDVVALNELRWFGNAPLRLQITAQPAVRAARGETGIIETPDYRDVKVLAAYTYIPRTGWGLICKQDTKELNVALHRTAFSFVLILLLVGATIIVITLRFSASISTPIIQMNDIAQRMRLGDFSQRNEIHSTDELGMLELEFNNMADEIESRIKIQSQIHKISETMLRQNEMKEFSMNLLRRIMKISDANMGVFYILNETQSVYEPFFSIGANEKMLEKFDVKNPAGEIAQAIFFKKIYHLRNIADETTFKHKTLAGELAPNEIITIPIVNDNIVVAIISLVSVSRFNNDSLQVIEQSQIGINTSYSNLLASERTRILSEQLTVINQQLEEQTEELQDQAEELQDQANELKSTTTELQRQNVLLDIQRKQVEEANKLKSEFLSNMSHELRTPLNSIMALSKVLLEQAKTKLNEEENNYLEIIERNGRRLLAIINDILDLSKIEAGKMDVILQNVSITSLLYTTAENLQTLAEKKKLTLDVRVLKDLPMVVTDEFRLHQVLTNVIGNAIKFTESGDVTVSASYDAEFVKIKIKDTGIGISEEMLEHIFDEFRQVDGSISRRYEGTGLGLAIAKKIMLILGGNISVTSKLGYGSEFTLSLPMKKETEDENVSHTKEIIQKEDGDKSFSKTGRETTATENIEILMVEDNPDTVIQMKNILGKKGYSVVVAENGLEALKKIEDLHPRGIILDLMMPEMDGFEFLEKIRNSEKTKEIPVLILTAKYLTQKETKILEKFGIRSIIRKGDVNLNRLVSEVELLLNLSVQSDFDEKNKNEKNQQTLKDKNVEILIVEDNIDNLVTIKALLADKYLLKDAASGEEGLKLIDKKRPDLILVDMSLPQMSGNRFLSQIREKKKFSDIPVIAVTAQAMKGDKEKFINFGFDGYVSKPIDLEKLINEIRNLLK
ncbi:response regulator [Maribellus comscasis]|uniref:histidine kinase n=1 Tax=Maribellus comscasis TaxID=2681766 RepID=A0A6I6JMI0_9BACT|nr:response regulator [Maribellus comscasis]QGY44095.1 response regulator [Maribellus comscasis]